MTVNVRPEDGLTDAQWAAVVALASGGTQTEAANAAGCTLRTLRRWRRLPPFADAVLTARAETVATARERLAASAGSAVRVLASIADDESKPAAARVTAARALLTTALDTDVHDRLTALEEAMNQ